MTSSSEVTSEMLTGTFMVSPLLPLTFETVSTSCANPAFTKIKQVKIKTDKYIRLFIVYSKTL